MNPTSPNHALQRTRYGVAIGNQRVLCAGSLSLSRQEQRRFIKIVQIAIIALFSLTASSCTPKNEGTPPNSIQKASQTMHYCESLNDLTLEEAISQLKVEGSIDLAVSKDFWAEDAEAEWEACEESFSGYFTKKVAEYSKTLGDPSFRGGMEDPGFPKNYVDQFSVHADQLVTWNYQGQLYGLAIVQEDRELPFVVSFVKIRPM